MMRGGPRKANTNHDVLPQTPDSKKLSVDKVFSILGGQDEMEDVHKDGGDTELSVSPKSNVLLDGALSSSRGGNHSSRKTSLRHGAHTPPRKTLDNGTSRTPPKKPLGTTNIQKIVEMGFSRAVAEEALNNADGDLFAALEHLVSSEELNKKTSTKDLQNLHSPSKSLSGAVNSAETDRASFGPVPVLTPTKTMSMQFFPIASGDKKDVISDLDPDKVIIVFFGYYCSAVTTTFIEINVF